MIPNFKTYLKESHWSEMNRRSQGIKVRKEDDITDYDLNNMANYINSNYVWDESYGYKHCKIAQIGGGWGGILEMEVAIELFDVSRGVIFCYPRDKNVFKKFYIDLRIIQKYEDIDIENIFDDRFGHIDNTIYIYPKEKDVITNQDVIFIIDRLLATVEKPLIKKIKK